MLNKIEEKSVNIFRSIISDYESDGGKSATYRELTGRDYGIDGIVEIFENDNPTGEIAFIQIKGTADTITKLSSVDCVSCKNVSSSSLKYAEQNRVPVILCFVSIKDKKIYYIQLQEYFNNSSPKLFRKK